MCVCFLSETTYTFCSGRRTASGAKSRTRHKETTTAGETGEDGNNVHYFDPKLILYFQCVGEGSESNSSTHCHHEAVGAKKTKGTSILIYR